MVKRNNNSNVILVLDNGNGLEAGFDKNIFNEGVTSKENGKGIGLASARNYLSSISGEIGFVEPEKRTTFYVTIPAINKSVYSDKILLSDKTKSICIIDDDVSIHHEWQKKLKDFNIEYIDFFTSTRNLGDKLYDLYMVDYDLKEDMSGLEFIIDNELVDKSFLVTNNARDSYLIEEALRSNINLINKEDLLNIEVREKFKKIILVDDDSLIGRMFKDMFEKDIQVETYLSFSDFLQKNKTLISSTLYLIDNNLNEEKNGVEHILELTNKPESASYKNIVLYTGDTLKIEDVIKLINVSIFDKDMSKLGPF